MSSVLEVSSVFEGLTGQYLVIAKLLYGCGLRISEVLRLRVKDLDFAYGLGHQDVATTMIYTHVVQCEEIVSPLDRLMAA